MGIRNIFTMIALMLLATACASERPAATLPPAKLAKIMDSPGAHTPPQPLLPHAITYAADAAPVIGYVLHGKAAEKAGLRKGDRLLKLNGQRLFTAADFEKKLKFAPPQTVVTFDRRGSIKSARLSLGHEKPRLGAGFEPENVSLVRKNAPLIAFMHQNEMTVFAQSSVSEKSKELHVNLIIDSNKVIPTAKVGYSIYEKGAPAPIAKGIENIDALGSSPHLIRKSFPKPENLKGPLEIALNVDRKIFRFEFQ